ncbi:MAG: AraC family transcriptional regulator [Dyella sp.]
MKPNREIVTIAKQRSFRAFAHGYPYYTVRWHHHPEYEIHLVTTTEGNCFIGDYIGRFEPGQLVMMGPHLPHNWVSELPKGCSVPERCIVLQFSAPFIEGLQERFPELQEMDTLLRAADFGLQFSPAVAEQARPLMSELCQAQRGLTQARLFLQLLELLGADGQARRLSGVLYNDEAAELDTACSIEVVLKYLQQNYMLNVSEAELARLANKSPSAFSRVFRRTVGVPFVKYLTELRINAACELLTGGGVNITEICYQVGFNSVSNFNRRFAAIKGMSPMAFRRRFEEGRQPWQLPPGHQVMYRSGPPPSAEQLRQSDYYPLG